MERFGDGPTVSYWFYDKTVEVRYAHKPHIYYLVEHTFAGEEILTPLPNVSTVCHIIDKSEILIPWACKVMANKLLATVPVIKTPLGDQFVNMQLSDFERLVTESKRAHKDILEDAGNVGTIAHNWIEMYIKSVLANDTVRRDEILSRFPENERARNGVIAAMTWMQSHNVRWICTERKIYSREFRFSGTEDGKAMVDSCDDPLCCPTPFKDRVSTVDWKTSNYLYYEYILQISAYDHADAEEFPEEASQDGWIIRLGKEDAECETWHIEDLPRHFETFMLCLRLKADVDEAKVRLKARADAIKASEPGSSGVFTRNHEDAKCQKPFILLRDFVASCEI